MSKCLLYIRPPYSTVQGEASRSQGSRPTPPPHCSAQGPRILSHGSSSPRAPWEAQRQHRNSGLWLRESQVFPSITEAVTWAGSKPGRGVKREAQALPQQEEVGRRGSLLPAGASSSPQGSPAAFSPAPALPPLRSPHLLRPAWVSLASGRGTTPGPGIAALTPGFPSTERLPSTGLQFPTHKMDLTFFSVQQLS